ncbi:amino acid adenylation domain-containing protein [Nonomuraea fuscirosea]|uniref:Amino acid adenylation domain-containing protein n=1 Tax=Nonomuraea fuscirosea TaxID=1291556 RepID=A0A2T0MQD6_9ACTN|nr:non-ribosomal peptide synthetase [Nonomuraea fuscirosea]PRX60369.1 amino acid adenylation domain-containing protein [Nonomuraea fuscirosea]
MPADANGTLVTLLRARAAAAPGDVALEFDDGKEEAIDYAGLDRRARALAALLAEHAGPGERALLVYPPGLDYVAGFFGCLYAGLVAVPVYPPVGGRGLERLQAIAADAGAALVLTDAAGLAVTAPLLDLAPSLRWLATDALSGSYADAWDGAHPARDDLALLQYTSGSTGRPKGVMVRHGNLMANAGSLAHALGLGADSRGVSWLPPYHDMGLIGGILQPIYSGFPCTLMSPMSFLRSPYRWLEVMSRKQATISAAPDFAYLECLRRIGAEERESLDLSAWRHALVGAEPVRASTLDGFARAFGSSGFRATSFYPCYGLAEATLFVTGGAVPGTGPKVIEVDREELERGRAVMADRPGNGDSGRDGGRRKVVLTGCGSSRSDDLVVVVDSAGRACADGEVGEVWVGGSTVAAGYWRRPAETERAFLARLAGEGERAFLRTGDLGFQHDGELYITGRAKDLMVIRGRNHHPQDVEETASAAHPLLRQGRAAAFSVDDGVEERVVLVHEVTGGFQASDGAAVIRAIRAALALEHGLDLRDVALVRAGKIPRTTSGKVRRSECRARWLAGSLGILANDRPAPSGQVARTVTPVTELVAAAIDLPAAELDVDRPLVGLGLDSLRAARLSAQVEASGVRMPLDRLLNGMSTKELQQAIDDGRADTGRMRRGGAPERAGAASGGGSGPVRPSPAQEWIWSLDQLGAGGAYHVLAVLRLRGPLDAGLLRASLGVLVERHEALRSVFAATPEGGLEVTVRPVGDLDLPTVDLTGAAEGAARADELIRDLGAEPFDLAEGPLLRMMAIRLADDDWRLGVAAHHIAVDGWSLGLLVRRLGEYYGALAEGRPLPGLSAARLVPADGDTEAHEAFWRDRLAGARAVELPAHAPRPRTPSWAGAWLPFELDESLAARLRARAAEQRVTPFMFLLAALSAVLSRWSGQDDLVVGAPVAGRPHPEMSELVGSYVNTLPLRIDTSGDPTFARLLDRARDTCLTAYAHQDLRFERILRAAGGMPSRDRGQLVRVLLTFQTFPLQPWEAGGVCADPVELPSPGAQAELALHLTERPDGTLAGHAVYATHLFDETMIATLLDGLTAAVTAAVENPDLPVRDLPLLGEPALHRILDEFSGARSAPEPPGMIHELVEKQAEACPDRVAVRSDDGVLTYRELMTRADRLVPRLRSLGCGPDALVAVCLPRSPALLVALLAVLKAGGAYLPLDPSYPPERLAFQLSDTGACALLTTRDTAPGAHEGLAVLFLDEDPGPAAPAAVAPPAARPANMANLANVLYTSGSTGRPKGVMTSHGSLAGRLAWMQEAYPLRSGEVVLHKTPVGFDVSGWELFWPLMAGATVQLARPGGHRNPDYLARTIREQAVSVCHFVPSMLRAFLDEPAAAGCAATLRHVICSGEELPPALVARFHRTLPGVELHNLYGPTEAAIDVTAHRVTSDDTVRTRVPIGRAVPGARLYVLDPYGHPVPPYVPGELHIGGPAVARGYHGRPGLTAECFVPDRLTPGGRLYRTGDRARWLGDGRLEFLGRLDDQVKIRGVRIEPGEVENALLAHPGLSACAVLVEGAREGRPRLVAHVVPAAARPLPEGAHLREFLARRLPAAMVPTAFVRHAELPLGANGKLDRTRLAGGVALPMRDAPPTPPRTVIERRLAGIWEEVLGLTAVSVTDDFFDLGGDSLLATRIMARIHGVFGVRLPIEELLVNGLTIERLAGALPVFQAERADPEELRSLLHQVSDLTDEQVTGLLDGA